MKEKIRNLVKLLVVILLLYILVTRSDTDRMFRLLQSANIFCLVLAFGFVFIDSITRCWIWKLLLNVRHIQVSVPRLVYFYMTGSFFGTFLPSSFGTDIARIAMLSEQDGVKAEDSISATLVANLLNLLALSVIATASSLLAMDMISNRAVIFATLSFSLVYIMVFPFLLKEKMPFPALPPVRPFRKIGDKLKEFTVALNSFKKNKKTLVRVTILAFFSQFSGIIIVYTISRSLNLDISFYSFALFIPVITISRMIPVSVAGFGMEQGIFVYLFYQAGVESASSLMISLSLSVIMICFTLFGGILYAVVNSFRFLK